MTTSVIDLFKLWENYPTELSSNFEPLRLLGEGSYGKVILCVEKIVAKTKLVALKIANFENFSKSVSQLTAESQILQRLHRLKQLHKQSGECSKKLTGHCNHALHLFGQATDFFNIDKKNTAWLKTRYIKTSLTLDKICSQYSLTLEQNISIFIQLIKALKFLESQGYIHGDINPGNILVAEKNQQIKLIDFGTSKKFPHDQVDFLQSLGYLHPQAVLFTDNIDTKIDIWSFGCVLFEMISDKFLIPINGIERDQELGKYLAFVETLNGPILKKWLDKGKNTHKFYNRDKQGNYSLKPEFSNKPIDIEIAKQKFIIDPMMEAAREKGFDETIVRKLADLVIKCVSYIPPTYDEIMLSLIS